jgi:hypothetical protein
MIFPQEHIEHELHSIIGSPKAAGTYTIEDSGRCFT